jgi:hypothetical protein
MTPGGWRPQGGRELHRLVAQGSNHRVRERGAGFYKHSADCKGEPLMVPVHMISDFSRSLEVLCGHDACHENGKSKVEASLYLTSIFHRNVHIFQSWSCNR